MNAPKDRITTPPCGVADTTFDPRRLESLKQNAFERVRMGLPPPKEIYDLPYRDRIDWAEFPPWARPSDPELFEECGHEG